MMRSTLALTALFAAVLTLALVTPASVAQTDKPPANATSADVEPTATSGGVGALHALTLRKWRKGKILRVEVLLEQRSSGLDVVAHIDSIQVNGAEMVVVEYNYAHTCSGTYDCTVNASAWLDLDEAAAFDLNAFKGQPLVIEIFGRAEIPGTPETSRLRAVAQLIKK